jgi:hypothetical protein
MPRQTKKISASQWFKNDSMEQDTFLFSINQQFWKAANEFGITLPRKYSALGHIDRDMHTVTDTYRANGYQIAVARGEKQDLISGIKFDAIDKDFKFIDVNPTQYIDYNHPLREDSDIGEGLWDHLCAEHHILCNESLDNLIVDALNTHTYARSFIHFLGGEAGLLPRSSLVRAWQAHKIEYRTFKVTGTVYDDSSWFVDANVDPNTYNAQFLDLVDSVKWIHRT